MFQHQGIWLPDGERHFPDWMTKNGEIVDGRGTYQIRKLWAALEHCKQFRVAVDVGAHVGLFSMQLVKRFQTVHAFEPLAAFRECFERNVIAPREQDCLLYYVALGAQRGKVEMKVPAMGDGIDSGGTHVAGAGEVEMRALDEYDFNDVDYVKIDVEGYEAEVIKGSRETLLRCRPCVMVEQKARKLGENFGITGTPAVDLLRAMGAEVRAVISGDYILTWP
jgi:FkbM family methyltransferase